MKAYVRGICTLQGLIGLVTGICTLQGLISTCNVSRPTACEAYEPYKAFCAPQPLKGYKAYNTYKHLEALLVPPCLLKPASLKKLTRLISPLASEGLPWL